VLVEAIDGSIFSSAQSNPQVYPPERKARLLLEDATDAEDCARAARVVRKKLSLDLEALGAEPPTCC